MKIDKGIPIPSHTERTPISTPKLDTLAVGDSFFVGKKHAPTVKSKISVVACYTTIKYISRKEGEGARFWRVQ